MYDSVRPHRQKPTRLPCPRDSPGKNTGVGCHFLPQCMKGKSLSRIRLLATPWTAAYQAPPSMGFSRQEYWSGVPSPSPLKWYELFYLLESCGIWNTMIFNENSSGKWGKGSIQLNSFKNTKCHCEGIVDGYCVFQLS